MPLDLSGHTHHVHELDADGNAGEYIGGAMDAAAATTIAASAFAAMQGYSGRADLVVVVLDDTGTAVAFIGRNPTQAGLP